MKPEDYAAAYDLASEMKYADAMKFLRSELEITTRQAIYLVEKLAKERIGSAIHESFSRVNLETRLL